MLLSVLLLAEGMPSLTRIRTALRVCSGACSVDVFKVLCAQRNRTGVGGLRGMGGRPCSYDRCCNALLMGHPGQSQLRQGHASALRDGT